VKSACRNCRVKPWRGPLF